MSHGEGGDIDRSVPGSLRGLYQEVILDHYRSPRKKGELEGATHRVTMNNPLCGDVIELQMKVEDDRVVTAKFDGKGCSISQASASMLASQLEGRDLASARRLAETFTAMLHGDEAAAHDRDLGDLRALAGVARFPVRIKCALLAFNCLDELIGQDEGEQPS